MLNYILGPRDFNGLYTTGGSVCLQKMLPFLPDLLHACTKIIAEPRILAQHLGLAKNVVAHFSPFSFWRRVCYPSAGAAVAVTGGEMRDNWSILTALERVGGAECLIMLGLQVRPFCTRYWRFSLTWFVHILLHLYELYPSVISDDFLTH